MTTDQARREFQAALRGRGFRGVMALGNWLAANPQVRRTPAGIASELRLGDEARDFVAPVGEGKETFRAGLFTLAVKTLRADRDLLVSDGLRYFETPAQKAKWVASPEFRAMPAAAPEVRPRTVRDNRRQPEATNPPVRVPANRPATGGGDRAGGQTPPDATDQAARLIQRREFDPTREPAEYTLSSGEGVDPEVALAASDKANRAHHAILKTLDSWLRTHGWTSIFEQPGAIDLEAEHPDRRRVIFEAKTIKPENELSQTRHAIGQLLEYRHLHGRPADLLCLVTDMPLTRRRARLLNDLEIAVLVASPTNGAVKDQNQRGLGLMPRPTKARV